MRERRRLGDRAAFYRSAYPLWVRAGKFRGPVLSNEDRLNAQEFLTRLRNHYADQLLLFIAEQRRNCIRGEAEVKLELEPGSKLFHSLGCADFVRNDGAPEIIDLLADRALHFEAISTTLGTARLEIEQVRWDDV